MNTQVSLNPDGITYSSAICMMFAAASVQIAAAQALQQGHPRTQIAHKPLAPKALLSPSSAWHILCLEMLGLYYENARYPLEVNRQ